jgi:hypothetical protein
MQAFAPALSSSNTLGRLAKVIAAAFPSKDFSHKANI